VVGKADLGRVMISGLGHCPVLLFLPNHDLPYSLEIAGHRSSGRLPPVVIVVLWRRLLAASLAANGYPPHVIRAVPHTPLSLSLSLSPRLGSRVWVFRVWVSGEAKEEMR